MKFGLVIPAYNEEEAIARTVERCLEARDGIIAGTQVSEIQVIVVSDGSFDRTAEIARGYPDIKLIEFERNRGYGAAIKAGFEAATDADGTCDPVELTPMIKALQEHEADVVSGMRMGPGSQMSAIRRVGNKFFAAMIRLWGGVRITDSASGM